MSCANADAPATAKPVNVTTAGERTKVSIRPERVEINPELGPDAHLIEAEVKEMRWRIDYLNKHVQSLT